MLDSTPRIGIGTANFGLKYGVVSNNQLEMNEIQSIFDQASRNKIDLIDTAFAYGNAQERLGKINLNSFELVTKIQFKPGRRQLEVIDDVKRALDILGKRNFYAVLIHNTEEVLRDCNQPFSTLERIKDLGLTEKIGASIYDPCEAFRLLNHSHFDLIQCPYNVFDQRLEETGLADALKNKNVEIHVRSVFLQGLLLIDDYNCPPSIGILKSKLDGWFEIASKFKLPKVDLALNYVLQKPWIDRAIVGVSSGKELRELIDTIAKDIQALDELSQLSSKDLNLIDPRRWTVK